MASLFTHTQIILKPRPVPGAIVNILADSVVMNIPPRAKETHQASKAKPSSAYHHEEEHTQPSLRLRREERAMSCAGTEKTWLPEGGFKEHFGSSINKTCYWIQLRMRARQTKIKGATEIPSLEKWMSTEKRERRLFFKSYSKPVTSRNNIQVKMSSSKSGAKNTRGEPPQ